MQPYRIAATLFMLGIIGFPGFSCAPSRPPDLKPLVKGNSRFALDLYSALRANEGNLFFSPYSISVALAMAYGGARGNTAKEMEETLHFTLGAEETHRAFAALSEQLAQLQKRRKVQLCMANSLWHQKDYALLRDYLSLIKRQYGSPVTPLDFVGATENARQTINRWVEEKTQEKIRNLVREGDLSIATWLVLVNAIYFKGTWASQFDPRLTKESPFTLLNGKQVPVSMMEQEGKFGYGEFGTAQVLELPYDGNQLSMVFILPREGKDLAELEFQLWTRGFDACLSDLSEENDVAVSLPRLRMTCGTMELNEALKALGMRDAFEEGTADFSGMTGTKDLFISRVLHKAYLEVNEQGTEAAAATAVAIEKSAPRPFVADHPFLVLIRDRVTGTVLFLGRVMDPTKTGE